MASTSNNSGINGSPNDVFGPDEKWDDETNEQFRVRMEKKRLFKEQQAEAQKTAMPRCIG